MERCGGDDWWGVILVDMNWYCLGEVLIVSGFYWCIECDGVVDVFFVGVLLLICV